MKIFDFWKKMSKGQKIVTGISVVSVLVIIVLLIAVIITKDKSKTEEVISKTARVGELQDTAEKEEVEEIEEAVVLQESEEVSEEQLEAEKVKPEEIKTGKAAYYIKVNYGANTVTVYGKDSEGNYTVPVKAMVCSCGRATPKSGVYKTSDGYKWGTLIGGVYGQYSTRIVGSILFHSVPYTAQSPDSLEYWEFDKLGTTASAGCVRLMVSDAKWIYNNCRGGTMVEFYTSDDPGPLGKPSAPKISDNERCRGWDPTDPDERNPWRDEVQEQEQVEEQPAEQPSNDNQQKPSQNKPENKVTKPENKVVNNTVSNTISNTVNNTVSSNTVGNTVSNEVTPEGNEGGSEGEGSEEGGDPNEEPGNEGDNEGDNEEGGDTGETGGNSGEGEGGSGSEPGTEPENPTPEEPGTGESGN